MQRLGCTSAYYRFLFHCLSKASQKGSCAMLMFLVRHGESEPMNTIVGGAVEAPLWFEAASTGR